MNISITARKFKAHETLKTFIKDEVSSLEKFHDGILSADVILSYQKAKEDLKTAEITVKIPGQILIAAHETDDFKKSVTASVQKLTRQLDKTKSKKATARYK